jgi:hypothetical protein
VRSVQISYPLWSLVLWLYAQEKKNLRRLKTNKEEEEVGGRSLTLG